MDGMVLKPKKKSDAKTSVSKAVETDNEETIKDPQFTPPEKLAEEDSIVAVDTGPTIKITAKKASWWRRMSLKKKLLIFIPTGLVVLGGSAAAFFVLTKDDPAPAKKPAPVVAKVEEPPAPTTVASKLTGVQVTPELNQRGVTGVMIENSIDARPQAGLLEAGVIYEAIAEGGITRFLALFQESQPGLIGPVRSARPYYVNWLLPYNASYLHIGGSGEAIALIRQLNVKDMGENGKDNPIQRVSNRYAPHNAYTSMAKLDAVRSNRGWGNPDFTGLARKADSPSKTPTATAIDFKISSTAFYVHYDYDAKTNLYMRKVGGANHSDEKSGTQLQPKVVVALIIPYTIHPDGVHSNYAQIGSGQALIFEDGIVQDAFWNKPTAGSPLVLQDANGAPVTINAGQTWFTALGQRSLASYSGPPAPAPAVP